ncbi:MAG TPA: DUF6624 domain-containing protein [Acidimicrobiales bacterium]
MRIVTRAACTGLAAAAMLVAGTGCGDGGGSDEPEAAGDDGAATGEDGAAVGEPDLRRELLDMQEADQADRTGAPVEEWDDDARTARLAEIVDEHGWPTRSLVGDDGATAAWLIAQHSDLDVEFQARALELMRQAVDDGEADPTELAYLEDRVALNQGRPQTYGTQIACADGRAEPSELADPDRVEELRAEVGLQPLDDYLAELEPACQEEAGAAGGDEPTG